MADRAGIGPHIRAGGAGDAAMLAELGERTFRDTYAADARSEDVDAFVASAYRPEQIAATLAEAGSHYLIAEVDGAPVGFALLRSREPGPEVRLPAGRAVQLDQLYLDRAAQRRGAGRALLDRCRQVAGDEGYDVMWLSVWERNPRAIAFYRRHGFSIAGEITFVLGQERQRDLCLVARLHHRQ